MVRGKTKFKKAARRWGEAIETIYTITKRFPDRILVVTFESLVLDPRVTILRVCDFLGLAFEDRMLEGHKLNPYYPEARLDPDKVYRHDREQFDFNLERFAPLAFRQHQELVNSAHDEARSKR
jgi:hypothetical protein